MISGALHVQKPVGGPWVPCPRLCTRHKQLVLAKSSHHVEWDRLGFTSSFTTNWLRGLVLMLSLMPECLGGDCHFNTHSLFSEYSKGE